MSLVPRKTGMREPLNCSCSVPLHPCVSCCTTIPPFRGVVSYLSTQVRRQRAAVERTNLNTATERVYRYLLTEGNLPCSISPGLSSNWAKMLGLSRETLFRILAEMKSSGAIEQSDEVVNEGLGPSGHGVQSLIRSF